MVNIDEVSRGSVRDQAHAQVHDEVRQEARLQVRQRKEDVGAAQKAMYVQKEDRYTKVLIEEFAGTEQNPNMKDRSWLARHATRFTERLHVRGNKRYALEDNHGEVHHHHHEELMQFGVTKRIRSPESRHSLVALGRGAKKAKYGKGN
eukprot:9669289-Heterocapsa_arctica.AAC.1